MDLARRQKQENCTKPKSGLFLQGNVQHDSDGADSEVPNVAEVA